MTNYTESFFRRVQDGSASSASIIVPLFTSLFKISSVIDVGCGVGAWLKYFAENGVEDYLGIDGDYVPKDLLMIDRVRFVPVDLTRPIEIPRSFDAACSLEVAEHLPE